VAQTCGEITPTDGVTIVLLDPRIDLNFAFVLAGAAGVLLAAFVLWPLRRAVWHHGVGWVQAGTTAVALTLAVPVVLVLFQQTQHFRAHGLSEVGSVAFGDPPMSEAAAHAIRRALRPGESWSLVTSSDRCTDVDIYVNLYALYWLAFRLVPNTLDCVHPDVQLYLQFAPPRDATVVERGADYAVVRP
jgi:hypothetical protein